MARSVCTKRRNKNTLSKLVRVYITDQPELKTKFSYPYPQAAIFAELRDLTGIDLTGQSSDLEKVKTIAGYAHGLFDHDGDATPSAFDPVTIIQEAKAGKNFRCVEYGFLTTALLWAYGIPARVIGFMTSDVEIRDYGAGHVAAEFYSTEQKKWIMLDVQYGIMPTYKDVPLSAQELGQILDEGIEPTYELVNGSKFSAANDARTYDKWIHEYLYFFHVPLEIKFIKGYTQDESNAAERIILVPVGVVSPKVFQRVGKIKAQYTHSLIDFYATPLTRGSRTT